jgi:hypothetical protein
LTASCLWIYDRPRKGVESSQLADRSSRRQQLVQIEGSFFERGPSGPATSALTVGKRHEQTVGLDVSNHVAAASCMRRRPVGVRLMHAGNPDATHRGEKPRQQDRDEDMYDEEEGVTITTTKGVKAIKSFDDMGLREDLLRGIYAYGFEKPSAIQQRAIIPIIRRRDVIAQAQSGTGKSSLIAIVICQLVDTKTRECGESLLWGLWD